MVSGARRATANSSGALRPARMPPFPPPEPASRVAARTAAPVRYVCMNILRGSTPFAHEQRAEDQKQDTDGNGRIGDIEDQKGMPVPEMQIGEIDDMPEP